MLKAQRLQTLLEYLQHHGSLSIAEISRQTGVSTMTAWRDLGELEAQGLLRRVRGGAVALPPTAPAAPTFANFDPQNDPHALQKAIIGRYAAERLIQDGDSLIIEAGSTASTIVPYLRQSGLTILTNGLMTALWAAPGLPRNHVLCSGGVLLETGAFIGPQAETFFAQFRVKKVFFGGGGLTLEDGLTDPTPLYAALKRAMLANAEQRILLLDSSKLGAGALAPVLPLDDFHVLVTDSGANPDLLTRLRQRGIDTHVAGGE